MSVKYCSNCGRGVVVSHSYGQSKDVLCGDCESIDDIIEDDVVEDEVVDDIPVDDELPEAAPDVPDDDDDEVVDDDDVSEVDADDES